MSLTYRDKYLKIFSNCIPVKGVKRSIICDLQRSGYDFIPNDLFDVIRRFENRKIQKIYQLYDAENHSIIDEYINFLIEKEYAFLVDSPKECRLFPNINFEFFTFYKLNNAIVEYDCSSPGYDLNVLINELELLNCKDVELRIINYSDVNSLELTLRKFEGSCIQNIIVLLRYHNHIESVIEQLISKSIRISQLLIFQSPEYKIVQRKDKLVTITYSKDNLLDPRSCGIVHPAYFSINMDMYKESINHNSCLFGKAYIDKSGFVKNCPALNDVAGNINVQSLAKLISSESFGKLKDITKKEVKVCSNCEFRFICSDCRAYTQDPHDEFSKPLKCGYDPASGMWEDWSKNPLNSEGILHYGLQYLLK